MANTEDSNQTAPLGGVYCFSVICLSVHHVSLVSKVSLIVFKLKP